MKIVLGRFATPTPPLAFDTPVSLGGDHGPPPSSFTDETFISENGK